MKRFVRAVTLPAMVVGAIGLLFGSLLQDFQGFQLIMNFLVMPLFFLSGALFPLKGTPAALQWIARLDPLSYGIDAMRTLLNNSSHYSLTVDLAVLFVVAGIFVFLSSRAFARIQI